MSTPSSPITITPTFDALEAQALVQFLADALRYRHFETGSLFGDPRMIAAAGSGVATLLAALADRGVTPKRPYR